MNSNLLWHTKIAARIHDPAEKALVLLRDPAGHEGGTSLALARLLGLARPTAGSTIDPDNDEVLARVFFRNGLTSEIYRHVQRADWWAAAADRPQWPMEEITITTRSGAQRVIRVADWAQVRWTKQPVLIHPLTGEQFDLAQHGRLDETDISDIKDRSFAHFERLLTAAGFEDGSDDPRKVLLTFWRFGPELREETDNGKLGALWRLLPADTRVPDHSIWDHLDLTSAFAGAFAADPSGDAALLALSLGPVQSFIAAARSTSDLWAGSHLLSRLTWEAMRVICEELGPDAILFPRLRGVPQVDLWLRDQMRLSADLFASCEWNTGSTDSNPLFSAALPNRFVAVVPASRARQLADAVQSAVRQWLQGLGESVVDELLRAAGLPPDTKLPCYSQMRSQLDGFPEIHWAAVPFSLIQTRNPDKQSDLDTLQLSAAMAPFFGVEPGEPCGFLDSPAWRALQGEGHSKAFFAPNPGVLYPAVYDLAERVMAAAKTLRSFAQQGHEGWRCTLTGEAEWLTTDRSHLDTPAGKRQRPGPGGQPTNGQVETLWTRLADRAPAWARPGEHLSALPAIKRLWPSLYAREVGKAVGNREVGRFVVSTHTMALAHQIDRWLALGGTIKPEVAEEIKDLEPVALPRRVISRHARNPAIAHAKRIPALLDKARDDDEESTAHRTEALVKQILGIEQLEAYYALMLMDGDRMGQILSGDEHWAITYRDSFHPQVQAGFLQQANQEPGIRAYGEQRRALSPNRHLAVSSALNDFSLTVVRHVIEEEHLGRVIYAGGDDVMAMLPVADALSAMQRLRLAYSGHDPSHEGGRHRSGITLNRGFALLNHKLMRMMGTTATASCGLVVAHHQAPLSAVRRELDATEKRAKNYRRASADGGLIDRNAFAITIVKRSGGALRLAAEWGEPLSLLDHLRTFLRHDGVSRRAVYNSLEWLHDLPEPDGDGAMLTNLLTYQLTRQADKRTAAEFDIPGLAGRLSALALRQPDARLHWLGNYLSVAEFLARESRA